MSPKGATFGTCTVDPLVGLEIVVPVNLLGAEHVGVEVVRLDGVRGVLETGEHGLRDLGHSGLADTTLERAHRQYVHEALRYRPLGWVHTQAGPVTNSEV